MKLKTQNIISDQPYESFWTYRWRYWVHNTNRPYIKTEWSQGPLLCLHLIHATVSFAALANSKHKQMLMLNETDIFVEHWINIVMFLTCNIPQFFLLSHFVLSVNKNKNYKNPICMGNFQNNCNKPCENWKKRAECFSALNLFKDLSEWMHEERN